MLPLLHATQVKERKSYFIGQWAKVIDFDKERLMDDKNILHNITK